MSILLIGDLSVEQILPETFPKRISDYRSLSNLSKLKFHTKYLTPEYLLKGYGSEFEDEAIATHVEHKHE